MDSNKKTFSILFSNLIIIGILESIIGPLVPLLAEDLKVDLSFIGLMISIHTTGIFISTIISGNLIQLYGYKKVIVSGLISILAGIIGLYFFNIYYLFVISYLILGLGTGSVSNSTSSFICDLFPRKSSSKLLQLNTGWLIGAFIAPFTLSLTISLKYPWKKILLALFVIQVLVLVIVSCTKFKTCIFTNLVNIKNVARINKKIFSDSHFILSCIIVFLYSAITATFSFWFTTYFQSLNINVKTSSIFLGLYTAFTIFGMFFKNFLLKFFNEKKIMLFSSIISLISLFLALIINIIVIKIILIFIFGINIIGFIAITISIEIKTKPNYSGLVNGLINGTNSLAAIICQYTVGYFSENFSKKSVLYIDLILLVLLCVCVAIFYSFDKFRIREVI